MRNAAGNAVGDRSLSPGERRIEGLGGWLGLVGIGLVIPPFRIEHQFISLAAGDA